MAERSLEMAFDLAAWQLLLAIALLLGLVFLLGCSTIQRRNRIELADSQELAAELESLKVSANQLEVALDNIELLHRSKNQFYYSTSHDLRQPLHALEMFSTVLQKQELNETSIDIVRDILEVVKDISRETDVLLDIARVDVEVLKLNPVEIDLGTETRRIVNQFRRNAKAKPLQLRVTASTDQIVFLDRALFDRILRNLIDNAIKFTSKGFVNISTDYSADNVVTMSVIDSGVGINKEDQENIYREFYQAAEQPGHYLSGVGLGLNSVLKMIQRMGGNIEIKSPNGGGTSVTVRIPNVLRGVNVPEDSARESMVHSIDPNLKTVLILQSDHLVGKSTAMLIESAGYNIVATDSLSEAYALQKTNKFGAACLEFSGATDMARKFLETLRLLNPGMPIVVMASDIDSSEVYAGLSISVLKKPVEAKLLLEKIQPHNL